MNNITLNWLFQLVVAFLCIASFSLSQPREAVAAQRQGVIDSYAARVKSRVQRNLRVPQAASSRSYVTTARIELDPRGNVLGVSISDPSGNLAFDRAVMLAIRKAGSFGPPPFDGLRVVGLRFNSKF